MLKPFFRIFFKTLFSKILVQNFFWFFFRIFCWIFFRIFSGCLDASGSIIPLSVPKISPNDGLCETRIHAGIGYSRRLMLFYCERTILNLSLKNSCFHFPDMTVHDQPRCPQFYPVQAKLPFYSILISSRNFTLMYLIIPCDYFLLE